jgi:hypothetical protein
MAVNMGIELRKICQTVRISYRRATLSRTVARRSQMAGMFTRRKSIHLGLGFFRSARVHAQKRKSPVLKIRRLVRRSTTKPWNQGF